MRGTLAALAGALLALPARADVDLRRIVVEHRLANGMKFLLVRREGVPVFAAYLRVKAGGADEQPGKTGLAHLFEHLAFKGTPVIGARNWDEERPILLEIARLGEEIGQLRQGEPQGSARIAALEARIAELSGRERALEDENAMLALLLRNGGTDVNASTDKDMTSYFVSLPSNRLELWALLEASRLAAPVPRDFYAERAVVMEERRERVESVPLGALFEELSAVAFTASPYRWPTVGYLSDLESLTVQDALLFHREHYAPANAVAALVGDLDIEKTRALLERTFGTIPPRALPRVSPSREPPQNAERRSTLFFDAAPQLAIAFHKPTLPARDDYIFDVLEILLTEGRASRLYRALVTERQLAADVYGTTMPGARLAHLFVLGATALGEHPLAELEGAILDELERLKTSPVADAELSMVRAKLDAGFSREISTNQGLAEGLTFFEVLAGDWRYLADHRSQIASITAAEIARAAQTYFVPENRTVVYLRRPLAGAKEGER
jgi:predicted Zn-dependent peptidase